MTIELGQKVVDGASSFTGEKKPLKAFYPLKTLPAGHTIEGIYQGKFESKNRPGAFFHVFQERDGEGCGYGDCKALEGKIEMIKKEAEKLGVTIKELYAVMTYNGRKASKANPGKTYYDFTMPTIYKLAAPIAQAAKIDSDSIPF
jgi:hypothetical protein